MKTKINTILKVTLLMVIVAPVYQTSGIINENEKPLSVKSTRSDSWILDFQQNGINNLQWYYNNLNNSDRLKIRQALDWSIDRDYIVNDIDGYGTKTLSFIPSGTQYSLNNGTVPRQLDLTKAKALLAEVFGYTYNPTIDNVSTPYNETIPYFTLTDIYPSNNIDRIEWAHEIAENWKSIGIEVNNVDISALNSINDYINSTESIAGYGYDDGGFDVAFVGWGNMGYSFYSPGIEFFRFDVQIPQTNFTDPFLDELYNKTFYEQNVTLRNQAIYDYQQWMYNNVPTSYLFSQNVLNIKNKDLAGIDPSVKTNYENWTYSGHQNATISVVTPEQLQYLNPLFYPNQPPFYLYKDTQLVGDGLFRGMFYRSATVNQGIQESTYYPYFANWYNKSADGKTWYTNLKQGLKWHDGVELNSSDIKFTFDSLHFNNESLAEMYDNSFFYQPWHTGNIITTIINSTLIKFELQKPYSFFKEDYLTVKIIPKHILENIPEKDWETDFSNTGINGTVVGNGPYIYVNKSKDETKLTLQKWSYWDSNYQSLIINNAMNEPIPNLTAPKLTYINFVAIPDEQEVLNSVKNGSVDITLQTRYEYYFKYFLDQITDPVELMVDQGYGEQTILYNLRSPIWGIDAVDPCNLYVNMSCSNQPATNSKKKSINFDSEFVFLGLLTISLIAIYKRKRKLN